MPLVLASLGSLYVAIGVFAATLVPMALDIMLHVLSLRGLLASRAQPAADQPLARLAAA
jgi:hypothetical protein